MTWEQVLEQIPGGAAETVENIGPWAGGAALAGLFWWYAKAVMGHALRQADRWPTLVDAMQARLDRSDTVCEERLQEQAAHYDRELADLRDQIAYLRAEVAKFHPQ